MNLQDPQQIEHLALRRLALLEAFRADGLRDLEKRTRDVIVRRLAEPISHETIIWLDNLYECAMPATRDGRIDLCSHNPLVADVFPSMSERATFVLIAYLTDAGRGIEPI